MAAPVPSSECREACEGSTVELERARLALETAERRLGVGGRREAEVYVAVAQTWIELHREKYLPAYGAIEAADGAA